MSRRDIAVIVQETPVHIVEVRTGVQGKRGPRGLDGPPGVGLPGPAGRDMRVITTDAEVINVTPDNHGDFYVSTNEQVTNVAVVLGYTSVTDTLGNEVDTEGAAAFFVQSTEAILDVIPLNGDIEVELPLEKLNRPFGKGSTIGVVAKGNNKWTLFGDLASDEVVVGGGGNGDTGANLYWSHVAENIGFAGPETMTGIAADTSGKWVTASNWGQILNSTDNGVTWEASSAFVGSASFYDVGTNKNGVWLLLTDFGTVYRSTDNAVSFSEIASTQNSDMIRFANDLQGVWVGVGWSGMVRRSSNDGADWQVRTSNTSANLQDVATDRQGNWVAVGFQGNVVYSSDNGLTWQSSNVGQSTPLFAIDTDENGLWICCSNTGLAFQSTNNGASWTPVANFLGTPEGLSCNKQGVWRATGGSSGGSVVITESLDNGVTWEVSPVSNGRGFYTRIDHNQDTWVAVGTGILVRYGEFHDGYPEAT